MNHDEYLECDRTEYWSLRHDEWMKSPDYANLIGKDAWFKVRFAHIMNEPHNYNGFVLDVGCGCGIYSDALQQLYFHYFGVDTAKSAIDFARDHFGHPNKDFYLTERDKGLPFSTHQFDCVFSCTVLQHMTVNERLRAIQEIKRVLKPDGLYVGLEMQNGQAPDMPQMSEEQWIEAWEPFVIVRDNPPDHPDWINDNVYYTVGRR